MRMKFMKKLYLLIGEDEKKIEFNIFQILNKIEYDDNSKIIYDNSRTL